jgi:hypothetical protein
MEPIYGYVPGTGWVASYVPHAEIYTCDKVAYRIELRKPNPGEVFRYTYNGWDLDAWVGWCRNSNSYSLGLNPSNYQDILVDNDKMLSIITIFEL